MADNVDGLVIEIESGASEVGSQLDILTSKLEGLKKTVGSSTPLKTFSRNYQTLIDTISNSTGMDVTKLEGLRAFTQVMSNMNNIKISSSIATQLNNLDFVVQHLSGESLDGLYSFINAMSSLVRLKDVSISASFVKNLDALANFATRIEGRSFKSLNELTSALANLGPIANMDASAISGLNTSVKTLSESTRTASTRGRTYNTVLANIRVRTLALVRVTQMIRRATTQAIGVYGDYVETLNLFKMAMGGAGKEAYEFAEKAQALLGIDLTQWMKAQGVFNALASGFGVSADRAAIMSKNLTQLAYDISSFYNIDVDTAVEKVRSGFSGQIRPVRDLGYDLSQARLEAIALSLGIDKTVKSMTQAEKSQLRYIALMTQLKQVQGDLSRTLDSPINQMRILQAQLQQMYRSIGMTLLPILNKVLPYLNAILRVIKMIADEIAAMFGYTLPRITSGDWSSSVVSGAEDIEDELEEATGAAEKLKNTLASFDQINLISSKSGGSGSGAGSADVGGNAFDFELPEYDFLGDAVENKAQKIAESIMKSIRPVVDAIKGIILFVVDNFDTIVQIVETFAAVTIGKKLLGQIAGLFNLTNTEMEKFNKFISGLSLIVIGVQFSYLGGKDIGKGNVLEGFVKSALGIGTATLGGFRMAGPVGAVVGFTISVATTIKGYFDGKAEKLREECYEMFYGIKQDAKMLDEVAESWNKFVEEYTDPALLEKYNTADAMQKDVEGIQKAVGDLMAQYATGNLTIAGYAGALTGLYEELETATVKHMKAVDEAILASLNGPLGVYLEARGYDVKSLISIFQETTDDYASMLEKNRLKMQEYQHYIDEGIQVEHYKKKMEELIAENNKIYQSMEKLEDTSVTTFDKFKNIEINFENFDDFKTTMEEIEKVYKDATTSITDQLKLQKKKTEQVLLDPNRTEAEKQFAKESLAIAEEYWKEQLGKVNGAYLDLVQSFENQAAFNWEEVYNMQGLNTANKTLSDEMSKFDEIFEQAYGVANKERADTYFSKLIEYQERYEELLSDPRASSQFKVKQKSLRKDFVELQEAYKDLINSNTTHNSKLQMSSSNMLNILRNNFIKNEDIARHYEDVYSKAMGNVDDTTKKTTEIFYGETDEVASRYKYLGYLFDDESILVNPLYSTMMSTAEVLTTPSVVNDFLGGANRLMGNVAYTIADNKGNIQKSYMGALNMPLKPVVDLGTGLGHAIADGIASSATYIEEGTKKGTKGAAKELNRFGEGFAQFMREISSSTMTGFDAFYQAMGVGSITYTPPKIKTPRVKGYATGGFPDTADFFYANENGVPEYVGTMGGRTAVANNMEITKGVADGVYKAIKDTGLIGDVRKIASKDGRVVFAPSEEAGKVMQQSVGMYNGTGGRY